MRIYIIGKYTGLPRSYAVAKFNRSEAELIEAGIPAHRIVNPVKLVPDGTGWQDAMDNYCIPALEKCKAVFVQRDWNDSMGAHIELTRAMELRMDLFYEASGDIKEIANLAELLF